MSIKFLTKEECTMKKPDFRVITGVVLALILVVGLVVGLNLKSNNKNDLVQKPDTSATEEVEENSSQVETQESEFIETEEIVSEIETETTMETEQETQESESESQAKPQQNNQQAVAPKPSGTQYYIRVNRLANCVTVYTKDAEGNYSIPVKAMICSVGLTDATPLGTYKIYQRYTWRLLFGNVYGQYAVRFYGSYLFHSVPYTRQTKDTLKEGQYNMLGQPASQGCVRLSVIDSKWIYDNCANGTPVEIYESEDPGPLGRPEAYKISENSPYKGWDPTDPDSRNPWKKGTVTITGVHDITVNQGETADLMVGVSATDVDGLPLEVKAEGNVDWNTPGQYVVTYTAIGVLRVPATLNVTVTVNAVQQPEPVPPIESETPTEPVPPAESETPSESQVETEVPEETEVPTETTTETVPQSETETTESEGNLIN